MKTILSSSIFLVLVLFGVPESAQALDTYDTFRGNQLNPEKWVPNDIGLSALDIRRVGLNANVQNCVLTVANPPKRPMAHGDVRILDVKVARQPAACNGPERLVCEPGFGFVCVDDPSDECNPIVSGPECPGLCVVP